jgi:hypothetical protein
MDELPLSEEHFQRVVFGHLMMQEKMTEECVKLLCATVATSAMALELAIEREAVRSDRTVQEVRVEVYNKRDRLARHLEGEFHESREAEALRQIRARPSQD